MYVITSEEIKRIPQIKNTAHMIVTVYLPLNKEFAIKPQGFNNIEPLVTRGSQSVSTFFFVKSWSTKKHETFPALASQRLITFNLALQLVSAAAFYVSSVILIEVLEFIIDVDWAADVFYQLKIHL